MVSADQHTVEVPFAAVTGTQIEVNTLGGNDSLTIDLSLGDFPKSIVYDGGAQTTTDSLVVIGDWMIGSVAHTFTAPLPA